MRLLFGLLLALCASCPSACSFWFLSQMKLGEVRVSDSGVTNAQPSARVMCELIPSLTRRQRRLCDTHPELMRAVFRGAQIGVSECQQQFKEQRWNCTTMNRPAHTSGIGKIMLKLGSREASFVYAISSAGVVHAVARVCSQGAIAECACDNTRRGPSKDGKGVFLWGGCSDNVKFSARFARRFVDAQDRKSHDPMALMNLHNNRAGRAAVRRTVQKQCKCHGVSGSCATRTCWKAVGKFHAVGAFLYRKYHKAMQVRTHQNGKSLIPATSPNRVQYDSVMPAPPSSSLQTRQTAILRTRSWPKNRGSKSRNVRRSDLVFFEPSPDYCVTDSRTGSLGTAGRRCNKTSGGADNCDIMCCGRGYDTTTETVTYKCHCRFIWCCEVECKMCSEKREVYTCKAAGSIAVEPSFNFPTRAHSLFHNKLAF